MNIAASATVPATPAVERPDRDRPILFVNQAGATAVLAILAGTTITVDGKTHAFTADTPVTMPDMIPGEDYGVRLDAEGSPFASLLGPENPIEAGWIAGLHHAPGGNAVARAGSDGVPAINPASIWDIGFRPAGPDPRGMTMEKTADGRRFWQDIYFLGVDHKRNGTSRCGVKIADGNSLDRLNYHDAVAIMAEHGKRLPTCDEARAAAYGVTERSSAERHPKTTGLDAARTSACGIMQATGNLWCWITDGDPEDPRPSLFGGSWIHGSGAGSRFALLVYWPGSSLVDFSARGACDHLGPA